MCKDMNFKHNQLKEIYEQPKAMLDTLGKNRDKVKSLVYDESLERIIFLGMGSSYNSSSYAKYLLSKFPKINVDAISASEQLYYPRFIDDKTLIFAISQSGESAEIVKVVEKLRAKDFRIWCLTNSANSSLARLSDAVLLTYAGEEKGSSSKTFLSTIELLYMISVNVGIKEGYLPNEQEKKDAMKLFRIVNTIQDRLDSWNDLSQDLASRVNKANSLIILGRGYNFCTAMQSALFFKEVSKIHAEGMNGGDFRHGPIELTDPNFLIISLATGVTEKLMVKIAKEVEKLGGNSILITDNKSVKGDIVVDKVDEPLSPFLFIVPLQLITYNSAILKGRNPDLPQYQTKITMIE